ncbi:MAG: type IV-A pilus assembly ATPase PilB, type IV pilus assembly protein PilB [Candidatus Peregrinibacteria bacterium GW2011_GWE2_39_6]|nr:MAG: type IV-A pilus assembly ATPase PilB, type IV pilus assembly protein PilB [Candidatus Peregrinibacteria bacterium GW2011_GWF2_39_17]KKR25745.1 MAG: type IV-A pilus assembly ATPase PilB, type IV pilus assembly protein PilB [Candidatus Peregrinibacteria bacterium GW2011_GWE2_39_6]HCW32138.1 type II secretion system protein GspE [Candidatus Peregrinibacteria bacterium]
MAVSPSNPLPITSFPTPDPSNLGCPLFPNLETKAEKTPDQPPQNQNPPIIANQAQTPSTPNQSPEQSAAQNQLTLLQNSIISANIPQLVTSCLTYAIGLRSSDVHIEPKDNTIRIRFRVDGVLREIVEYPPNIHPAVVSRIKIMSNLKIDEQRIPQDGRAQVTTPEGREMDLRVSTLPTVNGEKVVMRIQERTRQIPALEDLGLTGMGLENLKKSLALPNGIILTTGPTGSGKTTTLYSCLQLLNKTEVNILTFEDPVEIQMNGLNQSQVHPDIEYDFARGLRAALRQDPDIMMVGEIRDRETIDVAIEASLTGHLVLSTIHTNSAVETLTRIANMGVPAFLMTATINTIIAQRLVRQLCQHCKKPAQTNEVNKITAKKAIDRLNEVEKKGFAPQVLTELQFYEPGGCDQCDQIGYHGRVGLYEVLQMNNELRHLLVKGTSTLDIEEAAIKGGMTTLEQSGLLKALQGLTTLSEVYRVARPDDN